MSRTVLSRMQFAVFAMGASAARLPVIGTVAARDRVPPYVASQSARGGCDCGFTATWPCPGKSLFGPMSVIVDHRPKKSASCFGDDMFVVPGQMGRTVEYEAGAYCNADFLNVTIPAQQHANNDGSYCFAACCPPPPTAPPPSPPPPLPPFSPVTAYWIEVQGGRRSNEVSWSLACNDRHLISDGPYGTWYSHQDSPHAYSVDVPPLSSCILSMYDTWGNGWDDATWSGLGQEDITLGWGHYGILSFVVPHHPPPSPPPSSPPSTEHAVALA